MSFEKANVKRKNSFFFFCRARPYEQEFFLASKDEQPLGSVAKHLCVLTLKVAQYNASANRRPNQPFGLILVGHVQIRVTPEQDKPLGKVFAFSKCNKKIAKFYGP